MKHKGNILLILIINKCLIIRYLDSNTSHEFHSKVRILIEHGVLNVQRQ